MIPSITKTFKFTEKARTTFFSLQLQTNYPKKKTMGGPVASLALAKWYLLVPLGQSQKK